MQTGKRDNGPKRDCHRKPQARAQHALQRQALAGKLGLAGELGEGVLVLHAGAKGSLWAELATLTAHFQPNHDRTAAEPRFATKGPAFSANGCAILVKVSAD